MNKVPGHYLISKIAKELKKKKTLASLPRPYVVKTTGGQVFRRNRRHLLKTKEIYFPEIPDVTQSEHLGGVGQDNFPSADSSSPTPDCSTAPHSKKKKSTD